jgi:hypothetical protein
LVLLGNLAWAAGLYIRFLRGPGSFASVERCLTNYQIELIKRKMTLTS